MAFYGILRITSQSQTLLFDLTIHQEISIDIPLSVPKQSHTNHYLNVAAHNHSSQRFSLINALVFRAIKLSEEDFLKMKSHDYMSMIP